MFSKKMVVFTVLAALIASCILFLTLSSRQPHVARGPGRVAISLVSPFQKAIVNTKRSIMGIWEHYFFLVSVAEENQHLRRALREAEALNHKYEETLLNNIRLRELLGLKQQMHQVVVAAQVVGKDPSPWFQTVIVDKGSEQGVEKGLPVVNPQGIVGLVVEAARNYAKVRLITDPNSAVDAVIQKNRARGIIKGGTSGYCVLSYVLRKHELIVGDTVVTSGMDGIFPTGLPIGRVEQIMKYDAGIFQDVTISPFVDFERLEEVAIILPSAPADPS